MKAAIILFALLAFALQASAGPRKWFRDGKGFWLSFALLGAASAVDVETTQSCIRNVIGCSEGNVILGQGRARQYTLNFAGDGAIAFLMHRMRNAGDSKWWKAQVPAEAMHVGFGVRNLRAK